MPCTTKFTPQQIILLELKLLRNILLSSDRVKCSYIHCFYQKGD